jgi:hypothetical protein
MPINKVEKTTIQGVISWYELQKVTNWTILQKKEYVKYYYNGGDSEEALNYLNDCLNDLKGDDNVNNCLDYILRLDTNTIKGKKTENCYLMFNLTGEHQTQVTGMPQYYSGNSLSKNDIIQIMNEYHKQREIEEIEDEIEDVEPKSLLAGFAEQTLSNPQVQTAIANTIMALPAVLGAIFKKQSPAPITSLAGIDNINEILKKLYSKGVTNEDLSLLSEKDQNTISMLLQMLRGGQ